MSVMFAIIPERVQDSRRNHYHITYTRITHVDNCTEKTELKLPLIKLKERKYNREFDYYSSARCYGHALIEIAVHTAWLTRPAGRKSLQRL